MIQAFDLSGKVVLISGGNGGIGLGMAKGLAEAGADLVIWGTNEKKNAAAEEALRPFGRRVLTRKVDVTSEAAVAAGMAEVLAELGRVDCVIANAGTGGDPHKLVDTTLEDFRWVNAINLEGTFLMAREACRHWTERAKAGDPGGSLVLVGSCGTDSGMPRHHAYAASKAALTGFMRSVLVEHARYGVRVNIVQPGFVWTEMTDHFREREEQEKWILEAVPMKRWGKPEEFAGIAVYLASDASAFQSGSIMPIDGGYLAT